MRALHYQCSAGIAGDMHLGAMVDLGVPEALLREGLGRLPCAAEFAIEFRRASKFGISGTQAQVKSLGHSDDNQHRQYGGIVKLVKAARLTPGVETRALAIFERIAVAEAKIHDIPVEQVHFHEVGAVDSIVDIVGAAICLDALAVERVFCDPVEVGSGFVDCAHGRLPVPAPATQEILAGVPCSYGGVRGEATTPTGAAILKASVDEFAPPAHFAPSAVGYGVGQRDFDIPNVLRIVVGECSAEVRAAPAAEHYKIEANIDDMSPEAYEPLIDHLLAAGASDVYITPIVMKKSRPAISLSVLCEAERVDELAEAVLNRSTTIGLRVLPFEKRVLPRQVQTVETRLGAVRVKLVIQPDGQRRWKSEFDDVRRLADEAELDYLQVKAAVDADIAKVLAADD